MAFGTNDEEVSMPFGANDEEISPVQLAQIPPPASDHPWLTKAADVLQGFGKGASLGLTPYIRAGFDTTRGVLGGNVSDDYATNLRVQKLIEQQAQDRTPIGYTSGQVAGSVASGLAGGGIAGKAVQSASGINPAVGNFIGSTASNLAQGGISGAANASPDQTPWEGAENGLISSGLWSLAGGSLAAGAKMLSPGLSKAAQETAQRIRDAENNVPGAREALRNIYGGQNYTAARSAARQALNTIPNPYVSAIQNIAGGALGGYEGYKMSNGSVPMAILSAGAAALGAQKLSPLTPISKALPAIQPAIQPVTNASSAVTNVGIAQPATGLSALLDRVRNSFGQ